MVGLALFIIIIVNFRSMNVFGEYTENDFISYEGRRIEKRSDVEHLTGVSVIECLNSCLASERCCAISYCPQNNTCLINVAEICCPETENNENWNLWIKSRKLEGQLPGDLTVQRPIDCGDVDGKSGVYTIYGACPEYGFDVLCDMDTDGGGWTVFQRRINGEIDFYLGWSEYEDGFGDLNKEFWIGNKLIHEITSQHSYVLRVDLEDFDDRTRYAHYGTFYIGDSNDKYRITVVSYSGDAGDSMVVSNGMNFSTKDQDNDKASVQCAEKYKGGWWYKACHTANLNGLYLGGPHTSFADGIEWKTWTGQYYSLKSVKMMIRRY